MFGRYERAANGSIRIGFVFKLDCSPPIATLDIRGTAFITALNDEEKRQLESELSQNRIPYPVMVATFSYVLPILSLLARELGLPPPVPPPIPQAQLPQQRSSETSTGIDYHL